MYDKTWNSYYYSITFSNQRLHERNKGMLNVNAE